MTFKLYVIDDGEFEKHPDEGRYFSTRRKAEKYIERSFGIAEAKYLKIRKFKEVE